MAAAGFDAAFDAPVAPLDLRVTAHALVDLSALVVLDLASSRVAATAVGLAVGPRVGAVVLDLVVALGRVAPAPLAATVLAAVAKGPDTSSDVLH